MKSLLNISDLTKKDFFYILDQSKYLISNTDPLLKNKNVGLIFEKNSTRTRLSFQAGINKLSGNFIDINLENLNLNRFETLENTFEMMGLYLDSLVIRTIDHKKLVIAKKYFQKPIINALSDFSHPCQALSDIYTLKEHFDTLENLNIVWFGDLNNVLYSFAECLNFLPTVNLDIFTDKKIFKSNEDIFKFSSNVNFHFDLNEKILSRANCIMTDVYNSMNDTEDKEKTLIKYQVNKNIMSKANKNAIFMHCLPAKIGSEVTEDVLTSKQSIIIKQAKNRLTTQLGIMSWLDI